MKAEVRLVKNKESKVKAFVSLTLELADTDLTINGCKVIDSKDGLWVTFPTTSYEKDGETKYSNIVYVHDDDAYEDMRAFILEEYDKAVKGGDKTTKSRRGGTRR